jgi:hypothetical protein
LQRRDPLARQHDREHRDEQRTRPPRAIDIESPGLAMPDCVFY